MPIVAVIGICLLMFVKRGKKKDIGMILLGFAVLMVGMSMMSDSVAPLKDNEAFKSILTMFSNPILGILAGLILTVIIQSSSASVGILQAMTATGAIPFSAAIPIVMGQNIGTCVTAVISSLGANKNGKRAAVIHLSFNVIGVAVVSVLFYAINGIFGWFDGMLAASTNAWDIAIIHTVFKLICVALIGPFYKQLEKLSRLIIRDNKNESETNSLLDERLLNTPAIAVERATQVVHTMCSVSGQAIATAIATLENYDPKLADSVRDMETKVDVLEDTIGSYLVKLSGCELTAKDSEQVTKLLHIIGDYERISDHAVNIVESAEEMKDKKLSFSDEARHELSVLVAAVTETLEITEKAFVGNDVVLAAEIESLEQIVDELRDKIKLNHIQRLQKSECTIEHGFVLSDLLTNFERVSDHCSNIASCVIEISAYDALDMHKYLADMRDGNKEYEVRCAFYRDKYAL